MSEHSLRDDPTLRAILTQHVTAGDLRERQSVRENFIALLAEMIGPIVSEPIAGPEPDSAI